MALDYFILVFISSLGIYQIAAIHAKLDGLCFFKHTVIQYIFGILAIIGALVWFFTSKDHNVHTTVEGSQQLRRCRRWCCARHTYSPLYQ